MKILYIHQYFVTPEEQGGTRSYWFAKKLLEHGHEVVMVTSTLGDKSAGTYNVEGIKVIYVKNRYDNYFSKIKRIASFLKFIRLSIKVAMKEKDVDLVFATSTPLTVGFIALYLKWRKGWRYIFEVRDLWPEFPVQIGAMKNKWLITLLRWFEKTIYQKAEHVVALSPGMKDGVVERGIDKSKVTMIPNMSKPDLFYPRLKRVEIMKKWGIDDAKFNIIHMGAMGVANGLEYIIDTALCLVNKGIHDVNFIFIGYGKIEPLLKQKCLQYQLSNVSFLGGHDLRETSEIVNCCDASITCFKNLPILYTNSPNKLFDSLSAGKPIIVNSAGWTKDLVEKNDCGFYVDPDSPVDFVEKILLYKDDVDRLNRWGVNARRLSEDVYDKSILSEDFVRVIENAALVS